MTTITISLIKGRKPNIQLPDKINEKKLKCLLKKKLGIRINSSVVDLYILAFTHGSKNIRDNNGHKLNFERLEFLGDSVIKLIVTEILHKQYRNWSKADTTSLRSRIICRDHLNLIGQKMGLIELVQTSSSVPLFGEDIHGNLLESLIGTIFVDMGYNYSKKYFLEYVLESYSPHYSSLLV